MTVRRTPSGSCPSSSAGSRPSRCPGRTPRYLPRLVLLLDPVEVVPRRARQGPQDAVLAVDDGRPHVATVQVQDWDAPVLVLGGAATARAVPLPSQATSTRCSPPRPAPSSRYRGC